MPERHAPADPHAVWGLFQQTSILASRYFESVTARFGLSYPQSAVLAALQQHDRALPLSHVARLLTQEAQSTTELADRLERRGYVRRIRDQRDRRLVLLELTDEGRRLVTDILPALRDAETQLFGPLDDGQLSELAALLGPLYHHAAERLGGDRRRTGYSANNGTPVPNAVPRALARESTAGPSHPSQ